MNTHESTISFISAFLQKRASTDPASVGAAMSDVVKITTYLTDVSRHAEFGKARTEAFPSGVPASTLVGTSGLVLPALLVEVDVIAAVGSGSS